MIMLSYRQFIYSSFHLRISNNLFVQSKSWKSSARKPHVYFTEKANLLFVEDMRWKKGVCLQWELRGNRSYFTNTKLLPQKGNGHRSCRPLQFQMKPTSTAFWTLIFAQAKVPLILTSLNHEYCSWRNQKADFQEMSFLQLEYGIEHNPTAMHFQTQTNPKVHAGYSLVLRLNIHVKVRLKALGNNAMERVVRDLWLLWL